MTTAPATREVRTWHCDSRRWKQFEARPGNVLVATFPKCGTTWMQRIVGMLLAQSVDPRPIMREQPWIDARFVPLEHALPALAAVPGRRGVKTHLPFAAVPFRDDMFYIHVVRDPRDVAMSWHNHMTRMQPDLLAMFDAWGLEEPAIGRPYPRMPADPRAAFHRFLRLPESGPFDDFGMPEYADIVGSWWDERHRPNLLQVHYHDLKTDLEGEMRRVAAFLRIATPEPLFRAMVSAADFATMRAQGDELLDEAGGAWQGGASTFLHRGTNGRWRDVLTAADLATYDDVATALLAPDLRAFAERGRAASAC